MRTILEVAEAFTPVGKLDAGREQKVLMLNIRFKEFAAEVFDLVPECPDRTAAMRKLLEAKMTCVQAVSHAKSPAAQVKATSEKEIQDDGKKVAK